jgi:hypothetical protein
VDCIPLGRLVEIALSVIMVALLGYQVTMPANDNAKYMFSPYNGQIIRMNTQDGSMEICDSQFKCKSIDEPEKESK